MPRFKIGILLATPFLLRLSVGACSCSAPPDPALGVNDSSIVFIGKVESIDTNNPSGPLVHFGSLEMRSGEKPKQDTVLSGPLCGYSFTVGESYLVYASKKEDDSVVYVDVCSGTKRLSQASHDLDQLAWIRQTGRLDKAEKIGAKETVGFIAQLQGHSDTQQQDYAVSILSRNNNGNAAQIDIQSGGKVSETEIFPLKRSATGYSCRLYFGMHTFDLSLPSDLKTGTLRLKTSDKAHLDHTPVEEIITLKTAKRPSHSLTK